VEARSNLFLKLKDSFVNWNAQNCPISSPVRLWVQKLFLASDNIVVTQI